MIFQTNNIPQNINLGPLDRYKNILSSVGSASLKKLYDRPVFIISAPRSGSTLLFETLSGNSNFWTLGEECHTIYRAIPSLDPVNNNFDSGALTRKQATPETGNIVRAGFTMYLRNHEGMRFLQTPENLRPKKVRFLEKTPRNSLNIPFLNKIFPEASYIFLIRDAPSNINSMIEAWEVGLLDGSFVTFNNLQGWDRKHWCMLLPSGWRNLNGHTLAEIAAFQWKSCNEIIMNDLKEIPKARKTFIRYEDFISNPKKEIERLIKFSDIKPDQNKLNLIKDTLPISKTTVSAPKPDKWKKRFDAINPLLSGLEETRLKLERL